MLEGFSAGQGISADMSHAIRQTSVLLVEDEALISELVAGVLTESGFKVHTVASGEDALDYLNSGSQVDVLFTDINLANQMDGSQLALRAREIRPDLPIVYASGRYSASAVRPLVSRSVFLPKPYDPIAVCTLIARLTATH
jgi:CheY-like chemotaxis protein